MTECNHTSCEFYLDPFNPDSTRWHDQFTARCCHCGYTWPITEQYYLEQLRLHGNYYIVIKSPLYKQFTEQALHDSLILISQDLWLCPRPTWEYFKSRLAKFNTSGMTYYEIMHKKIEYWCTHLDEYPDLRSIVSGQWQRSAKRYRIKRRLNTIFKCIVKMFPWFIIGILLWLNY